MKNTIHRTFLFLTLILLATAEAEIRADQAVITATLIHASDSGKGVDSSLRSYANTLKKRFSGYDSFEVKGRRTQDVSVPGNARVSLGGGNQVKFTVKPAGSKLSVQANWSRGRVTLYNTTFTLQRKGSPSVLALSQGDGALIMLFTVK